MAKRATEKPCDRTRPDILKRPFRVDLRIDWLSTGAGGVRAEGGFQVKADHLRDYI
jgi:hypothetical protein